MDLSTKLKGHDSHRGRISCGLDTRGNRDGRWGKVKLLDLFVNLFFIFFIFFSLEKKKGREESMLLRYRFSLLG